MSLGNLQKQYIPYFRPAISEDEIADVAECLRSGWLTSGPKVRQFEDAFSQHVGAEHAIAVNSCTAALHLAVEALGLREGEGVLVPTMTFAATAEIVRYQGGIPILVDCDPVTLNIDLEDAAQKLEMANRGQLLDGRSIKVTGVIGVHVGGFMIDMHDLATFATQNGLWLVEDAAHALPAAYRHSPQDPWIQCGQNTAAVTCYSFYANKTITTGEGGMAVTKDPQLEKRMRQMSLHGLSRDAWNRFKNDAHWDYRIVALGHKYNMTDVAATLGISQLRKAEAMRAQRERLATLYWEAFADVDAIELPPASEARIHSWHLYPIRLKLEKLSIDRNTFIEELQGEGVGCSVHWRPLHCHPYYQDEFGWNDEYLPVATAVWERIISLPLFPLMTSEQQDHVVKSVKSLVEQHEISG